MERETSAQFSFLLGLPAVILAGAVELHTLTKAGLSTACWLTLLVGYNLRTYAQVMENRTTEDAENTEE